MLYLRTGANGSCKTLFTLKDVREKQLKENRPVCWNGRFKLKPEIAEKFGWKLIDFKDWQAQQDGTIFLIDECHNDMPKRPNGSAVPPHINALAEHRARSFDFFLLTQHPANIDSFVTKLIGAPGWHQHLKRVAGGSSLTSVLQWDAVNNQCEKNGSGKTAQTSMRSQPKDVYQWYESAELHTAKIKIPNAMIVVALAAVAVPALIYGTFSLLNRKVERIAGGPAAAASAPASAPVDVAAFRATDNKARPLTNEEYAAAQLPRFDGLPHTAPRYDEVTRPVAVPVPAACLEMKSRGCKCYTQQGTLIVATPEEICRAIVRGGYFVDFDTGGKQAASLGTNGAPLAGSGGMGVKSPHVTAQAAPVPGDEVTAMDIALASKARTGGNIFAKVDQGAAQPAGAGTEVRRHERPGERSEP